MYNKIQMEQARRAAEEAQSIYQAMKKDAFRELLSVMEKDGGEFTANELADYSGLNVQTIVSAFQNGFGQGILLEISSEDKEWGRRISIGQRIITATYVLRNPDGSYDESKQMNVKRDVCTYRVTRGR